MTLTQMLSDLYRRLGYPSSPATAVVTRLTAFLNSCQQELLGEPGLMQWLARHEPPLTFASVASQAVYGLPSEVRIDAIVDRTNRVRLRCESLDWYRSIEPDPTTLTGLSEVYVPVGAMAVSVQPSSTGLWVVSSSASDTVPTATVETIRSGGVPAASVSTTLTGTTRAQVGSFTDHVEVVKFYLSAACVGTVSLYDAATSGNVLATIPIGQTFSRYQGVALWMTPASAITYTVDGERPVPDLVNGTDEPLLPATFHRVLVDGAMAREYSMTDDSRATEYANRYAKGVSRIRFALTCGPDYLPVVGREIVGPASRFGAWFPSARN